MKIIIVMMLLAITMNDDNNSNSNTNKGSNNNVDLSGIAEPSAADRDSRRRRKLSIVLEAPIPKMSLGDKASLHVVNNLTG